jgi:hypothetical protein
MDEMFDRALQRLRDGDFSLLAPLFANGSGASGKSTIVAWFEEGRFADHAAEAAEALTCASFLGECAAVEFLIGRGLDPSGGSRTGMNAAHVAAGRGHVDVLQVLLRHRVPLEVRNMYGGTVLGQAVWSAVHQPRPGQREAIEVLLHAGARADAVGLPTGDAEIDRRLSRGTSDGPPLR